MYIQLSHGSLNKFVISFEVYLFVFSCLGWHLIYISTHFLVHIENPRRNVLSWYSSLPSWHCMLTTLGWETLRQQPMNLNHCRKCERLLPGRPNECAAVQLMMLEDRKMRHALPKLPFDEAISDFSDRDLRIWAYVGKPYVPIQFPMTSAMLPAKPRVESCPTRDSEHVQLYSRTGQSVCSVP